MNFLALAEQNKEFLIEMRRSMHRHPELSGEEYGTIKYIGGKLREFGISFTEVADGGVIGYLNGNGDGKTLLLRADCDALPMEESKTNEKTEKTCVSRVCGAAHTCGHDFHTAALLTTAKILNEKKEEWKGKIVLYFERSEEKSGGYQYNLLKYIEDTGIHIDGAFAVHVNVGPAGVATIIEGPSHAGSFSFRYTIKGKGGHGARPYMANNPINCFQAIAAEIDRLRMNKIDPFMPVTLTICAVQSGDAANVIPDTLTFAGNGRFFNREEAGLKLRDELDHIVETCAAMKGCEIIEKELSSPGIPSVNHIDCAKLAEAVLAREFGKEHVVIGTPSMGSETFAYLSSLYPSLLLFFGVVNEEKGITYGIHHPKFDIDEEQAHYATAFTLAYAVEFLNGEGEIKADGGCRSVEELFCS